MSRKWNDLLATVWPSEFLGDGLETALEFVDASWPDLPTSREKPIFVLSAGWRSGSTAIQRLLNSDPRVLIFGEAYEHMFLWHQLAAQWKRFGPRDRAHSIYLPRGLERMTARRLGERLTSSFTATLTPPVADLKRAHYAYFDSLLRAPAARTGRRRWGFKGVRCDGSVAAYLAWLYPDARFVVVVRDPLEAWSSYSARVRGDERSWDLCLPDHSVSTAAEFAAVWRHCASGLLEFSKRPNVLLLRHEELGARNVAGKLGRFLGARLDARVLKIQVDAAQGKRAITPRERAELVRICGGLMRKLGYR